MPRKSPSSDEDIRLPHFPFFEAMAAARDEDDIDWRTTKAGLMVLRLFDNWPIWGAEVITGNEWGVHVVRRAVTLIDDGHPLRPLLMRILVAMREAPEGDPSALLPLIQAYAAGLEAEEQWALAADVYQTIVDRVARPASRHAAAVHAQMRMGECYTRIERWDDAASAYEAARHLARLRGDQKAAAEARAAAGRLRESRNAKRTES